jgi:predicted Zn-dependent peptidase
MRALLLTLAAIAVIGSAAGLAVSGETDRATHPRELKFEPLHVEIPVPERIELSNGMVLYYMEDRELPLIDMTIWFRAGAKYEPVGKEGLASLTGVYARNGGAGERNRMMFDMEADFLAAQVAVGIQAEHGEASLSVMAKDVDQGLSLLADLLRRPQFDPALFPLVQQSFLTNISRAADSPAGALGRAFPGQLYGDHPYGRVPTTASISAITRDDCVAFWKKYLQPDSMILGVAGDIGKDEIVAKLEKVFGDWKAEPVEIPVTPALERTFDPKVVLIPRIEGQSHIQMAHRAVTRTDPDRVTLDIMNFILGGGGFSSRLTEVVRVREGLAYSVYSQVSRKVDLGLWQAAVQTKGETTWKAIGLIVAEMKRIREEPVSDEELRLAKESFLNGMVFNVSQPFGVVGQFVSLEFLGYPEDWMQTFEKRIAAITKEDIQRVAKKYLRPDGLTIVIAGNPETFDERPEGMPEPKVLAK